MSPKTPTFHFHPQCGGQRVSLPACCVPLSGDEPIDRSSKAEGKGTFPPTRQRTEGEQVKVRENYRAVASATTSDELSRSARQNASSWSTVIAVLPLSTRETVACPMPTFRASSSCEVADSCMCAMKIRATAKFRAPGTSVRYRRPRGAHRRLSRYPYPDGWSRTPHFGPLDPAPAAPPYETESSSGRKDLRRRCRMRAVMPDHASRSHLPKRC